MIDYVMIFIPKTRPVCATTIPRLYCAMMCLLLEFPVIYVLLEYSFYKVILCECFQFSNYNRFVLLLKGLQLRFTTHDYIIHGLGCHTIAIKLKILANIVQNE